MSDIVTTMRDTKERFRLTVVGGDFDSDDTHAATNGEEWSVSFNITEDAGWVNDVLSINGTAHHIDPPHGEGENTEVFQFSISADADKFDPGPQEIEIKPVVKDHGTHFDVFSGKLSFTVSTTGMFDDITGYTFVLMGLHTEKKPEEPRKPEDRKDKQERKQRPR